MRIITILLLVSFFTFVFFVHKGFAQEEPSMEKGFEQNLRDAKKYFFGMPRVDFERRYLRDGTTPHNNQWNGENWHPEYWVEAEGSVTKVIDGFYKSGVIVDQYDDEVHVLEVGETFLRLSPVDQRHVVEFVDYAFKITEQQPHGIFYVVFDHKRKGQELLGIYTVNGLQFQ